jgi:hypothetical protein
MSEPTLKPQDIPCACVHSDGKECARIRDGFEPDDRRYDYQQARTCECDCHKQSDDDDWDLT